MLEPGWKAFEAYVAELLGLDATCSSGSTWHDKGDAVSRDRNDPFPLYAEAKYTEKLSFSLKLNDLMNYSARAAQVGKRFILPLRFGHRTKGQSLDYVVLSLHDFAELLSLATPERDWAVE
jgi:hypothetical protein